MVQTVSYRKLALFFLLWCCCWIILQTAALQYTFGFPLKISLADAAVTNLVIAIAGYDMILVMRYYRPRLVTRLAMSIALAVLCVFAMHHITLLIIPETDEYISFLDRSLFIRGLYIWLMITLVSALSAVWSSVREQQEIESRKLAAEQLAKEAELSRLRQQLQPHFLFNSLNSISALAGTKPEEARVMIQQLSDFLRGTLKKDDQQLVTLEEELQHLHLYLEIEKVRFGHRLRTQILHGESTKKMKLPSLLLQPVMENAIKFGLYDTIGATTIRLTAKAEKDLLILTVTNPFDPATAQPRRGTGFGLSSVQRRLYLLYARKDLLSTRQEDHTFVTEIKIPQAA